MASPSTCPFCHRCWGPVRPLPATARSPSCSWCWSSWPHTSPDPGLSSGTPPWRLLCSAGGKFNRLQNTSKKMQRSFVKRVCSTSAFLCALDATPGFFLPTDSYSACAAPKPWIYQKNDVRIRQTKQKKRLNFRRRKCLCGSSFSLARYPGTW